MSRYEVVTDARAELGECPLWNPRTGTLHWVDIPNGFLHTHRPSDGTHTRLFVRPFLSAVALTDHGSLVAAVRGGVAHLDPETRELRFFASIERENPARRLNDVGVDPAGGLWVGCVDDGETPGSSTIYRVDHTGVRPMITGLDFANGIAWSPDGRTLYTVDSLRYTVAAHDVSGGEPSFRDFVWQGTARDGMPDGLAIDLAGDLWVAFWGAGCLRRLGPDGTVREVVTLPAQRVSSCAFGGERLDTLYVTSAAGDGESSGAVFALPVRTPGLPVPTITRT
ncbi:SMP-30/gluconolactonase/LRE family protein [Amycolatopsis samaneae]|uniref:SMP-30/gluconolactonase/LRE family protein n=1 Tax=Amycolatopsis samaneae TaxID=664691 RepID=A0ABW5GMI1_9PSEU